MKKLRPNKREGGITLISLIIMIILTIILAAVTIKGVTGQDGLIISTNKAVDQHKAQSYKEQLEQLVHSIILEDSIKGQETTIESMAERIQAQDWIKSSVAGDKDIIVTTTDGYVYQVYYDPATGKEEVKFIGAGGTGEADVESIPKITVSYDRIGAQITATAECKDGIAKIELIYNGEVVGEPSVDNPAKFNVQKNGWYEVRATSNKGIERNTWVRVTSNLAKPSIEITSNTEQENEWYGKDDRPVEVTIRATDEAAVGIKYRTNKDSSNEYIYKEVKEEVITINTSGVTIVYAYVVDSRGNESEIGSKIVRYDNVHPTIGEIEIKAGEKKIQESNWYTTEVQLLPTMTDEPSKIAGYYWWKVEDPEHIEVTQDKKNYVDGAEKTLTIQENGTTMIAFQAKDKAGNVSTEIKTKEISKDSEEPMGFDVNITKETSKSFKITGTTLDETSGVSYYDFYIDGTKIASNNTGEYTVQQNIQPSTNYTVYVEAFDNAGNSKKSNVKTATTVEPEPPTIDELAIGDYVSYVPNGASSYSVPNSRASDNKTDTQTLSRHTSTASNNTDWRIWDKPDSTHIRLISTKDSTTTLRLQGANGYNNAVGILNDACSTMYKNTDYATAKSIDMDDYDKVSTFNKNNYSDGTFKYGDTKSNFGTSYQKWPSIHQYERNNTVNRSWQGTNKSALQWYSGNGNSSFTATYTYYYQTLADNLPNTPDNPYYALISQQTGNTGANILSAYWVASRCVSFDSNVAWFYVFVVDGSYTFAGTLYYSDGDASNLGFALRPLVTIDLTKCTIGANSGDGTYENPYSCEKK